MIYKKKMSKLNKFKKIIKKYQLNLKKVTFFIFEINNIFEIKKLFKINRILIKN